MTLATLPQRFLLFAAPLLLLLSSCAVYVTPDTSVRVRPLPVGAEIVSFAPTRGEGAIYDLGSTISFRVLSTRDGYITLTSYAPGNVVRVFERNVYVRAGVETELPGSARQLAYELAPPRGERTVRASFSLRPLETDLPEGADDEAETSFFVR